MFKKFTYASYIYEFTYVFLEFNRKRYYIYVHSHTKISRRMLNRRREEILVMSLAVFTPIILSLIELIEKSLPMYTKTVTVINFMMK